MPMDEELAKRYNRKSAFLEFCEKDGLSVLGGFGIDDLKTAPLKYWERLGCPAAYCHLEGSQGFVGVFIAEIPPGKSLKPFRHMYEEQVLILSGRGATQFWPDTNSDPVTLEWQAGSLFSPPLNFKHRHHNGSATEPVRFATANNLPLIMNVYRSADFVFNAPYEFTDRYAGQKDFFSSDFKPGEEEDKVVNFIPDLNAVQLNPRPERGIGFSRLGIHLSGNSMVGHIMAVESGTYKKPTATVPERRSSSSPAPDIRSCGIRANKKKWSASTGNREVYWSRPKVGITITSPSAKNRRGIWRCAAVCA